MNRSVIGEPATIEALEELLRIVRRTVLTARATADVPAPVRAELEALAIAHDALIRRPT